MPRQAEFMGFKKSKKGKNRKEGPIELTPLSVEETKPLKAGVSMATFDFDLAARSGTLIGVRQAV